MSDRELEATLHILRGAPCLTFKWEVIERHVDVAGRRIEWTALKRAARGWSDGELVVLNAALDMWNGNGKVKLEDLLYTLDAGNLQCVLEAIAIRRGDVAAEPRTELGRLAADLGLPLREVPSPPGSAPWEGHDSVRPSFDDDIVVGVRLSPQSLATLRRGHDVRHQRLDRVPGEVALYDLYVETSHDIDAVPAWDAPHSPGFASSGPEGADRG